MNYYQYLINLIIYNFLKKISLLEKLENFSPQKIRIFKFVI